MPRDDARSQEKPKRPSLARRATSMLPSIRNPLDFDGDGVVSRSDFIPHFLDRDGDGHFAFADMSHDMRTKAKKVAKGSFFDKSREKIKPGASKGKDKDALNVDDEAAPGVAALPP